MDEKSRLPWLRSEQPMKAINTTAYKFDSESVLDPKDSLHDILCSVINYHKLAAAILRHSVLAIKNMSPRRSARISAMPQTKSLVNGTKVVTRKTAAPAGRKRKAATKDDGEEQGPKKASTPKRSKAASSTPKKTKAIAMPPITPTPAAAVIMAIPYSSGDVDDEPPLAIRDRLADPLSTNAPLLSPSTSRLITNKPVESTSPSKLASSGLRTTTTNILDEACAHLLKVDPRLKPVVEAHRCHLFSPEGLAEEIDPFRSLVSGIIGQQVSGAAAKAIKNRFVALFHPHDTTSPTWPTPAQVAEKDIDTLRTAGLSQRKAEYIKGLAEKFANGELTTEMLFEADIEEVFEKLTAVRGLGKWSVEMFACFGLKRLDIFSTGDLGVQRGMAAFMGRDVSKLKAGGGKFKYMSEKDMLEISEKFAPYRSLFMWYMWRVEDVDIGALEQ